MKRIGPFLIKSNFKTNLSLFYINIKISLLFSFYFCQKISEFFNFFLTCFTQAKRGGIDVTEAEALIKNNLWVHEECLVECDWFKPFERLKLKGLTDSQKLMLLLQVDEYLCVLDYLTKTIDLRENWVQGLIKSLPSPILLSQESREKVQHMIAEGPIIGPYLEYLNSACNLGEACG